MGAVYITSGGCLDLVVIQVETCRLQILHQNTVALVFAAVKILGYGGDFIEIFGLQKQRQKMQLFALVIHGKFRAADHIQGKIRGGCQKIRQAGHGVVIS